MALVALVLGVPTLRLSGHYLAMATLGFNYVVDSLFVQWDAVTGGPSGLSGVPPLSLGGLTFDSDLKFHYLVWTFALVALTLCLNLVRSGVGRGLAALAARRGGRRLPGGGRAAPEDPRLRPLRGLRLGGRQPLCPLLRLRQPRRLQHLQVPGPGHHGGGGGPGLRLGHPLRGSLHHHPAPVLGFFETYTEIIHGVILVVILLFLPQGFVSGLVDLIRIRWARHRLAAAAAPDA